MKRLTTLATSIRDLWLILGITLGLCALLEASLFLGFAVRSLWHPPAPNFRSEADTYADRDWAERYYRELDRFEQGHTMRWRPYVYWRRIPYRSDYINIDADGLRVTAHVPPAASSGLTETVFMFGGSTMWGLGTADDATIPSLVSKEVNGNRCGIRYDVVNFGQYAYVSTQGVLELMLQLQQGHVPDVVVFADGVNDTFGAFQLGVPGVPYEEFRREQEFNLSLKPELMALAGQHVVQGLSTTRFLQGALKSIGWSSDRVGIIPLQYEKPIADRATLARAVVETYFNNVRLVRALGEAYGFETLFYWQPVIYLKEHLTEYERASITRDFYYPGMKEFYLETYAALRQRAGEMPPLPGFADISGMFGDTREPIFVDFNHVGDRGNGAIARRMAGDLSRIVSARATNRRQSHGAESGHAPNAGLFDLSAVECR